MMTHQISPIQDVREKARKALTDYLTMFIPDSWKDPLEKLRIILQSNSDIDWEALKGHALMYFDEKRLPEDRVECLARIERLSDSFREIYTKLSPADWHRTIEDIIQAANFRASKAALELRRSKIVDDLKTVESKPIKTKT
ncbi:hypothetical protein EU528_07485 [Candidatus Thorarchaeota archaeon]|nr:MAG: hypothetical protein EU528_07485 [Candidatus Thorarchaeota archaeon]